MRPGRGTVSIMFLVISGLGAFSCLSRPDYNMPLFAFLWWIFFHVPEDRKHRQQRYMVLFVLISCVQDVLYLIYWPSKWFSHEWLVVNNSTKGLHVAVSLVSLAQLGLKVGLMLILLAPGLVDNTTSIVNDWCSKEDEVEERELVTYHHGPFQPSAPTATTAWSAPPDHLIYAGGGEYTVPFVGTM